MIGTMLILVTYDVNTETETGRKRLRKVAKVCVAYGIRVQNSVFECEVNASELKHLRADLMKVINKSEDSLRLYNLGNKYNEKIEHYGIKDSIDQKGTLIY